MGLKLERRVLDKTANYTVSKNTEAVGTVFTNRGAAGAVTFTLPAPTAAYLGWFYEFRGIEAQNVIVAGAAAGDIVTLNDAAANSVALQTAGQIIGGVIQAMCIRTGDSTYKWLVHGAAVGHAYTVVT